MANLLPQQLRELHLPRGLLEEEPRRQVQLQQRSLAYHFDIEGLYIYLPGFCSSTDLLTCCNVDLWYPNVLVPLLIFAFTGLSCVFAQGRRCQKERLSRRRKFSVLYFTVLFAWDVVDQTASWWFWQYTQDVGASVAPWTSGTGRRMDVSRCQMMARRG